MKIDREVCLEIDWKKDKKKSEIMMGKDFKYTLKIKVTYVGDNLTLNLYAPENGQNILIGTTKMKFT